MWYTLPLLFMSRHCPKFEVARDFDYTFDTNCVDVMITSAGKSDIDYDVLHKFSLVYRQRGERPPRLSSRHIGYFLKEKPKLLRKWKSVTLQQLLSVHPKIHWWIFTEILRLHFRSNDTYD